MSTKRTKTEETEEVKELSKVPTLGTGVFSSDTQQDEPKPSSSSRKDNPVIYIGPSLPGGKLEQHSIFKKGLPTFLTDEWEVCPAIKELIIPINELAESRKNLMISGTREHALNQMILQYLGRNQ